MENELLTIVLHCLQADPRAPLAGFHLRGAERGNKKQFNLSCARIDHNEGYTTENWRGTSWVTNAGEGEGGKEEVDARWAEREKDVAVMFEMKPWDVLEEAVGGKGRGAFKRRKEEVEAFFEIAELVSSDISLLDLLLFHVSGVKRAGCWVDLREEMKRRGRVRV